MGYAQLFLPQPQIIHDKINDEDWTYIDQYYQQLLKPTKSLYKVLSEVTSVDYIESMLALRSPPDEEGIWHDDGSRNMGFSLSLCLHPESIKKGRFFLRHKESQRLKSFLPSPIGTLTCFLTGKNGYEHRVEQVVEGKRLMLVGWCNNSPLTF